MLLQCKRDRTQQADVPSSIVYKILLNSIINSRSSSNTILLRESSFKTIVLVFVGLERVLCTFV